MSEAGVSYFFAMDYDLNDYDDPPPDNDHSLANSPAPVVESGLRGLLGAVHAPEAYASVARQSSSQENSCPWRPTASRNLRSGNHDFPNTRDATQTLSLKW